MKIFRATVMAGALIALVGACSSPRPDAGAAPGAAADGGTVSAATLPAKYSLTVAPTVGEAKKIIRKGVAEEMGAQLAVLFPDRPLAPVVAGYDINRPFYFAGLNSVLPHSQDLTSQADLALLAGPRSNTGTSMTLTLAPAQTFDLKVAGTVLRCAVMTLHGSTSAWDIPACAWADAWTVGLVLDKTSPVPAGQQVDFADAVKRIASVHTAVSQPATPAA